MTWNSQSLQTKRCLCAYASCILVLSFSLHSLSLIHFSFSVFFFSLSFFLLSLTTRECQRMGKEIACLWVCDCNVVLSVVFLVESKFFLHSSRTGSKKRKEERNTEESDSKYWTKLTMAKACVCWSWCVDTSKDGCVASSLCVASVRSSWWC
jgi:hypothetical protein